MSKSRETLELARDDWRPFFETLTKEFQGHDATIEILSRDYGDQVEAEHLPFASITYDDKDDVVIVAVGGKDGRYPVELRHMIEHPQRILADSLTPEVPWAIEIVGTDDTRTIVTIRLRPALLPPH
ncbi:MAG TPA: DUF5335 family protein [Acidimicrobiales bacterium]|nr:DUF5335 family protein [Acidimicrobiales bacterium]